MPLLKGHANEANVYPVMDPMKVAHDMMKLAENMGPVAFSQMLRPGKFLTKDFGDGPDMDDLIAKVPLLQILTQHCLSMQ